MTNFKPTGVQADKNEKMLIIKWDDGHESRLRYAGLRANCPCVECKGGHGNMGTPANLDLMRQPLPSDVVIEKIEPMGSYALQFQWSDGHYTGIYTWAYLRSCDPELA